MKITRDNYEIYFLDYLDGNLDNELADELLEFLRENADLKEELQLAGSVKLFADEAFSIKKENLYKEKFDQAEVFNNTAVAFIEGDLSEYEKAEFEAFIAVHPEKQKELMLFRKTILQPDRQIVFIRKNRMYHSDHGKMVLFWFARVAAVMALAFMIYHFTTDFIVRKNEPENKDAFSENKNEKSQPADLPFDAVKKEESVSESENIAALQNDTQIKPKPLINLQESNDNKVDQEKLAGIRIPAEVPDQIKGIDASLHSELLAHATLVQVRTGKEVMPAFENEERFFGDLVKEKTGLDNLSLNKIARAGLSLVSSVSREKFNYETNSGGRITELNFESRLLAFTIPTNQE